MAKKQADAEPSDYEPGANYDVALVAPIDFGGQKFLPRHHHQMTGAFLNLLIAEGHGDAIGSATVRV